MRKKSRISKITSFALTAIMLAGVLSLSVFAADPVVFDFSKYDFSDDILKEMGGQGYMEIVHDAGKIVLMAECTDGYDPDDDPDGTGTKGDLYGTIIDFDTYNVDADIYQWLKISLKNASAAPHFEFHFGSPSKSFHVETSVNLDIDPNSDYKAYVYNVTEAAKKYYPKRPADVDFPDIYPDHWHGLINGFRLDFMHYEESGGRAKTDDQVYIEYIAFFDSKEAADAFTFTPARTAPEQPAETLAPEAPAPAPENAGDNDLGNAAPEAPEATEAPAGSDDSDKDSGVSTAMIVVIIVAAVAVIAIIVVIVTKSGKNKGKK